MPVHTTHPSFRSTRTWSFGGVAALMLAAIMASGTASAQQAGYVNTAPSARAPNGLTIDQGAGSPGMSAFAAAPHPTKPHQHGPDDPQAGVPGIQDPSMQGGSGS
ncbi:hypothetical protein [Roseomonas chloroacetimidivorans]|uniref:hypothetical protein n=1 Tax=Roseomonas chloroacetimidivorans TaxID=1766656 RepID=UPI003C77AAEF